MPLGAWEVQTAIYSRLTGDPTLSGLVGGRIFDDIPQGSDFPYVRLGDENTTDDGGKDYVANQRAISVEVFSRYAGSSEAKRVMSAVYDLLHEQGLTVSGQQVVLMRHEFSSPVFMDPDGLSRHGSMRFRLFTANT